MNDKRAWLLAVTLALSLTVLSHIVGCHCQVQASGAIRVTHNALRLGPIRELKAPNDEIVRYAVLVPFQIGPNMAAMFVNRGVYNKNANYDSEDGNDLFLFDALEDIRAEDAIALSRSGVEADPDSGGDKRYFNRYPLMGGFVPYGARLNGKPHPHAETGFAVSQVLIHPIAPDGTFRWRDTPIKRSLEVFQLAYDGDKFRVTSKEVKKTYSAPFRMLDSKWNILGGGMSMAIPDGADLLFPVWAGNGTDTCVGVSRWRRVDGSWQVVAFIPIAHSKPKQHNYYEASLIRDIDGALIFAARDDGRPNMERPDWGSAVEQDINAWRSTDGGMRWTHVIHVERARFGPMVIGRSADGLPFIAGNPIVAGKTRADMRNVLCLWPLNAQRDGLESPMIARDATKEFGKSETSWRIDHPVNAILRLADGKTRSFLSYRVRDAHVDPRTNKGVSAPSPQAGSYLEEVIGVGAPLPIWQEDVASSKRTTPG